jgi:HSP20 family molecular chaperone IbpA
LEAERALENVFERFENLCCRRFFQGIVYDCFNELINIKREGIRMPEYRIKVAPNTVAYADAENRTLIVEFAIPGAPTDTIDVKILEDSVHLTAPARNVEYVSALALGWPVKPAKAEATYEHGLLRIEVPFKDPMEDAVKVAIKASGPEPKAKIAGA